MSTPSADPRTAAVPPDDHGLDRYSSPASKIAVFRSKKPDIPTIADAVEKFFTDLEAQQLSGETIRKYEDLLNSFTA